MQAGSLIISLLGDIVIPRGGRIWLGSMIRLLEPMGLNERLIRTSVFRLAKEEWLRAESVGRRADYLPTETGRKRFLEASRHIYASNAPAWDRRWRLILLVGEIDAQDRESIRRALFWQGFGAFCADCFVHPGADLTDALDALAAEGLGDRLGRLMPLLAVGAGAGVAASDSDLVARAWNLEDLAVRYENFVETYLSILNQLRGAGQNEVTDGEAFQLRLLLMHDYRRLLLRDPELPDVLLPADWPGQRARQVCKDIYRRLLAPSERHLDLEFRLADDTVPPTDETLVQRFPNDDPLDPLGIGMPTGSFAPLR